MSIRVNWITGIVLFSPIARLNLLSYSQVLTPLPLYHPPTTIGVLTPRSRTTATSFATSADVCLNRGVGRGGSDSGRGVGWPPPPGSAIFLFLPYNCAKNWSATPLENQKYTPPTHPGKNLGDALVSECIADEYDHVHVSQGRTMNRGGLYPRTPVTRKNKITA